MLGRSVGLSEAQLAHLGDDPLPEGVYSPSEAAIVRYARQSTLHIQIDDELYAQLESHFSRRQIIDICLVVGQSNLVNRFHATFRTDVDEETLTTVLQAGVCPIPLPIPKTAAVAGAR
ncbi:MAG: hypothetical protein NVSMB5_05960 [Candidatus Velthaea sp.]